MLKSLSLINFQSHKDTTLEFHPGVNVILGSSRSGKTAILRALNWNRYNKPAGLAFNSYWNRDKKKAPIKSFSSLVVFEEEKLVERKRDSEFNGYICDGNTLEAIGQDVPAEVEKIWNMSEVNIQKQFDQPFMLSESAAEVARFFNKTIKLDKIDSVLSNAETQRRKINQDIVANAEAQRDLTAEIESMAWMADVGPLIELAERRMSRLEDKRAQHLRLESNITEAKTDIKGLKEIPSDLDGILSDMAEAEKMRILINSKIDVKFELDLLLDKIGDFNIDIVNIQDFTKIIKDMNTAEALDKKIDADIESEYQLKELFLSIKAQGKELSKLPDADKIDQLLAKILSAETLVKEIEGKKGSEFLIESLIDQVQIVGKEIQKLDRELIECNSRLPEICPLCSSPLKGDKCE